MKATVYFVLLAVVLVINALSILGAALLDKLQFDTITANTHTEIDRRFKERSTKIGAWVMDRDCITEHIGFPIEDLPSYKWAQQHNQEAQ